MENAGAFMSGSAAAGSPPSIRKACAVVALGLLGGVGLASALATLSVPGPNGVPRDIAITTRFFVDQDRAVLIAGSVLLLAFAAFRLPRLAAWGGVRDRAYAFGLAVAGLAAAIAVFGTFGVFRRFDLSRDEIMADFDAAILHSGHVSAELPAAWHGLQEALVPAFLLPSGDPTRWVSGYLPGNAALRALVGLVVDPGWTNPLLLAIAVWSVSRIAARLWPERPEAPVLAALLLATSSQALIAGMTSYAMTAHLALNLIWLQAHLRGGRAGHAAAMAVGFAAAGLHQMIFHPLFVAPFLVRLWRNGNTRLCVGYIFAYAAILAFWSLYWQLVGAAQPSEGRDVGLVYVIARILWMLGESNGVGAELMLKNVLRFAAWQNLAVLPLCVLALRSVREGEGIARPLLAGVVLTLAAMAVLLPFQGHGWGYRYLHGFLGSLSLLALYGLFAATRPAAPGEREGRAAFLVAATAISLAVLLPVHLRQAEGFLQPYREAFRRIVASPADLVLIDDRGVPYGQDLVRNDPYLRNTPKMVDYTKLSGDQLSLLCRTFTVQAFDRTDPELAGLLTDRWPAPYGEDLRAPVHEAARRSGCAGRLQAGELRH